jgi:hypothetical protein
MRVYACVCLLMETMLTVDLFMFAAIIVLTITGTLVTGSGLYLSWQGRWPFSFPLATDWSLLPTFVLLVQVPELALHSSPTPPKSPGIGFPLGIYLHWKEEGWGLTQSHLHLPLLCLPCSQKWVFISSLPEIDFIPHWTAQELSKNHPLINLWTIPTVLWLRENNSIPLWGGKSRVREKGNAVMWEVTKIIPEAKGKKEQ